jgi:RNA recognition motif-containing protein
MNIFVAKLNFKTKREDLEKAFAAYGEVTSVKILRDRDTGRSKGYGFVEMPNADEAQRAMDALNNSQLDEREIVVKPANSKTPGESSSQA